ncbi:tetratricopeptide repeat protein [Salinimicrobium tongyeongense]|uniref:Tetratricopeptide repeat protein n=1 Tax=Salinimicrobium tongyeongense TaxID=2809707 RepID=A0ABY6NV62_9FLAO|nr:tetratricopeptide repeat protein [Salinimicrobium tongyeongense]UZH56531.1 tetratricopeptide repeat protein [Salinimicrobium tongyeongense]
MSIYFFSPPPGLRPYFFCKKNKNVERLITSAVVLSSLLCLFLLTGCKTDKENEYVNITETEQQKEGFVGSKTCMKCHQQEYNHWKNSHHDLAMTIADSTTVLGNFNNTFYEHKNVLTKFFKKGEKYYVNTEGPDGQYHDYEVIYTFGVYPLQQYLVAFPQGEFQALLTAWDSEKQQWFSLEQELEVQHEDWLKWTGGSMRWNTMCADCHSTNLEKNFDPASREYHTTFSEINVSCEACHGPGKAHTSYYQQNSPIDSPPEFYMANGMSSNEIVEKCARCHSRRSQITEKFDYKGHFLDHYNPELLVYPTYEMDGQIKDEDYVYGSFIQSKMYQAGVSCLNCHNTHTTETFKSGNKLCLKCHQSSYDEPSHHMHQEGTEATLCINCHMTGKIYMGNDFRRDHSFRIPRPDQSVLYGTPNACNTCHQEKSAQWASDKITENFGEERKSHFSDLLIPGQLGDVSALEQLIIAKEQPDIVRATAVRLLSAYDLSPQQITLLKNAGQDLSPLVRNEVVKALSQYKRPELNQYIASLLQDNTRLVRINAARFFIMNNIPVMDKLAYKKAQKEYFEYLKINADFPTGQHELGLFYQAAGNHEKAIKAYQRALEIDSYNNRSRMNMAYLQYQMGNIAIAESLYKNVTEQEPQFAEAYYMLGLLYNETGKQKQAGRFLSMACGLEVPFARACYNYALLLQQNGDYKNSIEVLDKALKHFPNQENLLYVRLIAELKLQEEERALKTVEALIQIAPQKANYIQIKKELMGKAETTL